MTETVFGLVTQYGVYVIFASAFLSCLALPIPTSLMMLTGGAFVASGDLSIWQVGFSAFAGAVLGDQAGYFIGKFGGAPLLAKFTKSPARASVLKRAETLIEKRGGTGVFLSTWAVAPLGPWVNFTAGATGLSWHRFSVADVLGECIWVTLYVGLGYIFMDQVATVADIMGDVLGLIASLVVVGAMLYWVRGVLKAKKAQAA